MRKISVFGVVLQDGSWLHKQAVLIYYRNLHYKKPKELAETKIMLEDWWWAFYRLYPEVKKRIGQGTFKLTFWVNSYGRTLNMIYWRNTTVFVQEYFNEE